MSAYKITDIFSYVSKDVLTLKQVDEIFKHGIDEAESKYSDYNVKKLEQFDVLDDSFKPAIEELNNDNRNIAFVLKDNTVIAIIGYKN